jgi:hypothetical protein
MARALVKVRVSGLDEIPWFFNFSEGETSDSWTVQCEIISATMLGAQAQDEDFPPDDPEDLDPNHFDLENFCELNKALTKKRTAMQARSNQLNIL